MRELEMAPEVAELIGPEQCARLASDNWDQPVDCWECGGIVPATDPAAVLVIWPEDHHTGSVRFIVHAHPECATSEIRKTTVAEARAHIARRDSEEDAEDDVDVVATVWDCGNGTGYPMVSISFPAVPQRGHPRRRVLSVPRAGPPVST